MYRRFNLGRRKALLVEEEIGFGLELPVGYSKTDAGKWFGGELKDWYWQVSYAFPPDLAHLEDKEGAGVAGSGSDNYIRENIVNGYTYGSPDMTMRRLYKILSDTFFNKTPFLDYYFVNVFPALKQEFTQQLDELKSGLMKYLSLYPVGLRESLIEETLSDTQYLAAEFAKEVKEDIKTALQTGRIVSYQLSPKTQRRRERMGLPKDTPFYATGQLIDSIIIICTIQNKKWKVGNLAYSFFDLLFGGR